MKNVDKYLKAADEAIKSTSIEKDGVIKKAYKGAVSAFGASIIMSGLVPTIQFYMEASDNRDSDTKKIVDAIAKIIYHDSTQQNAGYLKEEIMRHHNNRQELDRLKRKVTDAAIALKIMMRSYRFTKEGNE